MTYFRLLPGLYLAFAFEKIDPEEEARKEEEKKEEARKEEARKESKYPPMFLERMLIPNRILNIFTFYSKSIYV